MNGRRTHSFGWWWKVILGTLLLILGAIGLLLKWTGHIEVTTDPLTYILGSVLFMHLAAHDD